MPKSGCMKHKKHHKAKKSKKFPIKIVLAALCIAVILWIIIAVSQKDAIISVNGQKITQDYVDKQVFMNFQNQQTDYEESVNSTINKVLLLQDAKNKNIEVSSKEADDEIISFLESRMLSKQELESRLKSQDLSWSDFKDNYQEQMVINKLLNDNIYNDIKVTDIDIALYYKEHKEEINENFDAVKESLRKTIEQNKKQELLDTYLSELIKDAKIEYLGEYKKIKKIEGLAKCLSDKSVLYGSSWCPHCTNQKQVFGSSVKYINFVDCESTLENQNLCVSKGLQAYPTWEINSQLYLGEKSFEELAELSGCTYQ